MEVLEITHASAVVSWTVEYALEEQLYYVVYGSDEETLNQTSYSVIGSASLTNQTYNITLDGLRNGTTYYIIVIASFDFTILFSDTVSFMTIAPGITTTHNQY